MFQHNCLQASCHSRGGQVYVKYLISAKTTSGVFITCAFFPKRALCRVGFFCKAHLRRMMIRRPQCAYFIECMMMMMMMHPVQCEASLTVVSIFSAQLLSCEEFITTLTLQLHHVNPFRLNALLPYMVILSICLNVLHVT